MKKEFSTKIATVTFNPAIDETIRIEGFREGKVNRVLDRERHAGGKGINVATFLSDYGFSPAATGFLGVENDAVFRDHFSRKKIRDCFLRIKGETRTGIKIIDTASSSTTDINYPGIAPDVSEINRLRETVRDLADTHSLFVISGSVPAGSPTGLYRDIVAFVRSLGKKTIVDTSGEAFHDAIAAHPDIIKPNIHELEEFSGVTFSTLGELALYCRELLKEGISLVVVSMGYQGALFVSETEILLAVPPASTVVSTVGAGDAMVAGIAAGIGRGLTLTQTASLATAFSLIAITHIAMGIDSPDKISSLADSVSVYTLSENKEELWLKSLR